MPEPQWLSEREERAWRRFIEMAMQVKGKVGSDLLRDTGVSEADYGVLVHLSEAPDGRLRPNSLGATIGWEKSRLSHHLARMQQRGLVKRAPCNTDNRGSFVSITAAGRRAIERAAPRHVEHVRATFIEALTPAQLDSLAEIAEAVLAKLAEECHNMP